MSDDPHNTSAPDRAESEARGAELREELATTDLRRAEEDEAKAEQAIEEAKQAESKKERKRREAEERRVAAAAEADEARRKADETRSASEPVDRRPSVSGAAVTSPGLGGETDPKAAAAASGPRTTRPVGAIAAGAGSGEVEKPELYVAAAFAGAFLFARILKRIAE